MTEPARQPARRPTRHSSRGRWTIVAIFALGVAVLTGLFLAPRPASPAAPPGVPWGVPGRPLTVVFCDARAGAAATAGPTGVVRALRGAVPGPDFLLLLGVDAGEAPALAAEFGMQQSYHPRLCQRAVTGAGSGGGANWTTACILSRHPLYDATPVGPRRAPVGVSAVSVVDGCKFLVACTTDAAPGRAESLWDGSRPVVAGAFAAGPKATPIVVSPHWSTSAGETVEGNLFGWKGWATVGPATSNGPTTRPHDLGLIRPSDDKAHFVLARTGERIVMWGFNYDHDDAGRLLEDYWADEWGTVAEDFREMKALGANVVRIHLQLGRFMTAADRPDGPNLERLGKLVRLAEETGLYLDVTGLGCYHKRDVPAWYDALDETSRWDVQARFWKAVAGVCRDGPAVFCYDLMNEPVVSGGDQKNDWLPGQPLGGKHFVQRITTDPRGRTDAEIAKAWVARLTSAVRSADDRHMVTVGIIPWAQVFKGGKDLFVAPEVCGPLDFVSVHFYPKAVPVEESLAALKAYAVGKPLVIEEIFPLEAGVEKTEEFIEKSRPIADGWVSFYWGKTIEENKRKGDGGGLLMAKWLERFYALSPHAPADDRR